MRQDKKYPDMFTTNEIKNILKTTLPKVYRLIESGKLKAINVGAGSIRNDWRVKKEDLENFLNNGAPVIK